MPTLSAPAITETKRDLPRPQMSRAGAGCQTCQLLRLESKRVCSKTGQVISSFDMVKNCLDYVAFPWVDEAIPRFIEAYRADPKFYRDRYGVSAALVKQLEAAPLPAKLQAVTEVVTAHAQTAAARPKPLARRPQRP